MAGEQNCLTKKWRTVYLWAAIVFWSLLVASALLRDSSHTDKHIREIALNQARAHFEKDVAIRAWAVSHGGVYVALDQTTQPDQSFSQLPDRDALTATGKKLTLLTPATMIRQISEKYPGLYRIPARVTGHHASMEHVAADPWEEENLAAFAEGVKDATSFTELNGKPVLRLMRPLVFEEGCLHCHESGDYTIGEIAGGIGMALPMDQLFKMRSHKRGILFQDHLVLWLVGLIGIGVAFRQMSAGMAQMEESEERLRRGREQLRLLMDAAGEGIFGLDGEGKTVFINPAAARMLGYDKEEILGRNNHALIHHSRPDGSPYPEEECCMLKTARDGTEMQIGNEVLWRKDGSSFPVEYTSTPLHQNGQVLGAVVIFNDISERLRLEQENLAMHSHVQQSQKYRSLNAMAAGIAHNFNNILTAVIGNLELALLVMPEDKEERRNISAAFDASQRAARLSTMMLTYVGQGKVSIRPLDLESFLNEMKEIVAASIRPEIRLHWDLTAAGLSFLGDQDLVRQILMQLVTNAAESLEEGDGEITIRCGLVSCSCEELRHPHAQSDLASGEYVFIEVEDTGVGMDAEALGRAFEPFFSTKFSGRGMGLASVLGIMRNHKGTITLESAKGTGTRARVLFPALKVVAAEPVAAPPVGRETEMARGTVLLVDDEEMVLDVGSSFLDKLGFEVLTAKDGLEALEIYESHRQEIALVLLDIRMPRMDGLEALAKLRQMSRELPVVMATGYAVSEIQESFPDKTNLGFVQKPFSLAGLEEELEKFLP